MAVPVGAGSPGKSATPAAKPPATAAKPPPAAPTSMNATQWAQLVAQDMGINVTQDPNAVLDLLAWMPHEEPASSWWGGFGSTSDPTRLNPLNAGDIGQYGYTGDPVTGNVTGGGLGTYPTLTNAAAATAQMIGQKNMSAIANALKSGASISDFTSALKSSPWAGSHYAGVNFTAGGAQAEAQGPSVTAKSALGTGAIPGAASQVSSTLANATNPSVTAQIAADNAIAEQLSVNPAELAFQQNILKSNYGYTQQQFGIEGQQLGLQQLQSKQQAAYQLAERQIQEQQYNQAIANIQKAFGFTQQQEAQQQSALNLQTTQGRQNLAASGTYLSGSHTQFEQGQQLAQQGLDTAKAQAAYNEQQQLLSTRLQESANAAQYGYSAQQIADGQKNLELQQQALGISKSQAANQYQSALEQLNLNNLMNVDQLQQQIFALASPSGAYSPLMGIANQLQGLIPGLAGAMGGSSPTGNVTGG